LSHRLRPLRVQFAAQNIQRGVGREHANALAISRELQAALAGPSIIDAAWLQDLTDSQVDSRHRRQASRSLANRALDALLMDYVS